MIKKIIPLLLLFGCFEKSSHAQQLVRATDVNMVTTAGTKIVIDGGGISFIGTSVLTSTADSIYLVKTSATSPEGWLDSTATGVMNVTSTGNVFFRGTNRQSFFGKTRFYDLTIRNTAGDTLLSSCEVRNLLHLDTGYVFTKSGYGNDSLLVSSSTPAAIVSTSGFGKSWVHGRLSRIENQTGAANEYLFPIGKIKLPDSLFAPIKLDKFNSTTNTYTAEYFPCKPFNNTIINNPPVDHISSVEYWEISATIPNTSDADVKVSLSWRTYSQVSPIASVRDSLIVAQYVDNGGFKWDKTGTVGIHAKTDLPDQTFGYIKHRDYIGALSFLERRHTLGTMSKYNALPIRLIYFTAVGDGNKVRLNWEVANEQDTRVYEVQKSLTATSFTFLSNVSSRQLSHSAYTDFDYAPAMGWNYYRLKIIDKSGSFSYSPVRAVKFSKGMEDVKIFPVPATDVLNVQLPSSYINNVTLQLFGVDGKYIATLKPAVSNVQINVKNLAAATYVLKMIKTNDETQSYPFIKQ